MRPLVVLGTVALFIHIAGYFPFFIETYYSTGLYPWIGQGFRRLLGWIPFSIGDLLYMLCIIFFLWACGHFLLRLLQKKISRKELVRIGYRLSVVFFIVYITFKLVWGLNYHRIGITAQLPIEKPTDYTTQDLAQLTHTLLEKTNASRRKLGNLPRYPSDAELFKDAVHAYQQAHGLFPFLRYTIPSLKKPIFNELGNYLGYTGYLNPFTLEAQVHTHVPPFSLPFTICHEIAHQLGYATEDEANFVGYLAATQLHNHFFDYSTYFALYRYANRELWYRDSALAEANDQALDPLVKQDYEALIRFYESYQNKLGTITTYFYHQYLKANEQPQGIETYSEVTALILAYFTSH